MTELEWLKQESGMTDDELKAMESVAGSGKFKAFLVKAVAANTQAATDKQTAEQARLDLENRYNNEFLPEMRKVTQDSLRAQGEAASAQAALKAAREYGIVPDEPAKTVAPEVRAPGSPSPTGPDFNEWSQRQSNAIIKLNDLNAEHYKLFKEPLGNSQELVDMVTREHTLGHRDFTLQKAWEQKFNVPAKRQEISAAEIQKGKEDYAQQVLKEDRQKNGSNPNVRSGVPSRFSTYKPSDADGGTKPWQTPSGMRKSANQPWRDKAASKLASVA